MADLAPERRAEIGRDLDQHDEWLELTDPTEGEPLHVRDVLALLDENAALEAEVARLRVKAGCHDGIGSWSPNGYGHCIRCKEPRYNRARSD